MQRRRDAPRRSRACNLKYLRENSSLSIEAGRLGTTKKQCARERRLRARVPRTSDNEAARIHPIRALQPQLGDDAQRIREVGIPPPSLAPRPRSPPAWSRAKMKLYTRSSAENFISHGISLSGGGQRSFLEITARRRIAFACNFRVR